MNPTNYIFVYGTLKQGEEREKCWPRKPLTVEAATLQGALYDLGPYPALIEGGDMVAGELWRFAPEDVTATLTELDKIEGHTSLGDDEYRRVVVVCQAAGTRVDAWVYWYARVDRLRNGRRIMPDENGMCQWSRAVSS